VSPSLLNIFSRTDTAKEIIGASVASTANQAEVSKSALLARKRDYGATLQIQGRHSRSLLDLWMAARNCDFKTALRDAAEWAGVSLNEHRDGPSIFSTLDQAIAGTERQLNARSSRRDWYHNRKGNEYFVVVRFAGPAGKQFRPFCRNGSGWIAKDPPGKLPLFRLPELVARSSERVFIVEGEKCVCELETLGLLVITSAHGAKSAHKTDWQPLAARDVVILPDNDAEGRGYAQTVAQILSRVSPPATVRIVEIPGLHPKGDCVDWLEHRDAQTLEDIRAELLAMVKNAPVVREAEADNSGKRQPLTIRTIDEILKMSFDDKELVLTNGYLALGERTAICGMGGVGKSRLVMQLALCCRTGRDFLGWETRASHLRWLFLQTENSCRRLKYDLNRMLSAFTPEEQKAIKSGVFFHTLEADDDGFLMLDLENSHRIADAIDKFQADIVVFDPLRDFSLEDLNSDKFMIETLRDIVRVTKRGNPKRVPLTVHHAATGKAGVQKLTGWERSSFGRNSKALQMMARAQINIAPAKPDDNSAIIIASGKCNNAPEFTPFAARLSFETMLYARDDDFDLQSWEREVSSSTKRRTFSPQLVRELDFKGRELEKKTLAKLIKDETGCGTSRAYELIDEARRRGFLHFSKITKTYAKA
jgi:AAA domain-containing protein